LQFRACLILTRDHSLSPYTYKVTYKSVTGLQSEQGGVSPFLSNILVMITESTKATMMLLMIGAPGLYLNMLTALSFLGATTPFEMICACHAVGNAGVIAVMMFCSAPMIYLLV
ncbi:hypothetical protein OESDEN_05941, partial [Oesophagostomum dentatum]